MDEQQTQPTRGRRPNARDAKRAKMIDKYAAKRKELKELGDQEGLAKLPRNSSPTRRTNSTGRGRPTRRISSTGRGRRIWCTRVAFRGTGRSCRTRYAHDARRGRRGHAECHRPGAAG